MLPRAGGQGGPRLCRLLRLSCILASVNVLGFMTWLMVCVSLCACGRGVP